MLDKDVYTAEKIIATRNGKGRREYLIKWQGYSAKNNSWEPWENILDKNLIHQFEKKRKQTTSRKSDKATPKRLKKSSNVQNQIPSTNGEQSQIQDQSSTEIQEVVEPQLRGKQKPHQEQEQQLKQPQPQPQITEPIPKPLEQQNNHNPIRPTTSCPTPKASITATESKAPLTSTPVIIRTPVMNSSKKKSTGIFITDVTVNDVTTTICESKNNHGFFREISRYNVAVDTQ